MKVKHLMIVTLLLAILTIGAVSASDDISDETLSEDIDSVDELAVEESELDSVLESSEDVEVMESSDSDVLGGHGVYNGYDYYAYIETGSTYDTNPEVEHDVASVEDEGYVNGIVTFSIDGVQLYSKTYSSADKISTAYVYSSDFNLPARFQSGIHTVKVDYYKLGATAISASTAVEFKFNPTYRYMSSMSVGETNYIRVIAGPGASGTATLYKYDSFQGRYNIIATAPIVNGRANFPVSSPTKARLDYALGCVVNGQNFYVDDLIINVESNSPGYSASATSKIYVGNSATVTFKGSKIYGDVRIYVDGKQVKQFEYLGGKVSENIPGLTVGVHQITVKYDRGHDFFSKTFNVNVVKKPVAKKISLKLSKVTVKKSAKKLVLKATLKINKKKAKGKKVKFKFNGKTYKAKTNKKGVAKVTIKKKVLKKLKVGKKVKYQVSYGKKTVKRTVKVKK